MGATIFPRSKSKLEKRFRGRAACLTLSSLFIGLVLCRAPSLAANGEAEIREVVVTAAPFFSVYHNENFVRKRNFKIPMVMDEASETGFKIPKNIDEFDEFLRISLGSAYFIYVQRFSEFYCNKIDYKDVSKFVRFFDYVNLLNIAWKINDDNFFASTMQLPPYHFFENPYEFDRVVTLIAMIYDEKYSKNKSMIREPYYCTGYYEEYR
ncbi:hypothetical protein L2U69_13120 [Zavarzinia compransoris]|uniref:hypothetical protein n=1 Tax=Zavarzinia marina TaxID=2911065 RepID=UPI001F2DC06F|nr:hypothetical protein [Zavarzinia marina]MCF4166588.1 hypothetical protein [Zavarzinia marina]